MMGSWNEKRQLWKRIVVIRGWAYSRTHSFPLGDDHCEASLEEGVVMKTEVVMNALVEGASRVVIPVDHHSV